MQRPTGWAASRPFIEAALARRHLRDGALLLYNVTSTYLEGRCCELAQRGYSRDHQRDRPQIVIGLMCAADGCPIAVEVFEGNTADPGTVAGQIDKLRQRFGLRRVVMVGDRGMLTQARTETTLRPAGLDWITALRAPAIQALAAENGPLQMSLFDDRDMAEITSPDYPGERLVVSRNPLLAAERARKRQDLPAATEADLRKLQARVERAFRSLKTVDLELRPVFHWTAPRVRAHVLLCMLAYHLEWHSRQCLAPLLFDDHDTATRDAQRTSPKAKAVASPAARAKVASTRTDATAGEVLPVHSFRTLLADLATLTRNVVRIGRDRVSILPASPTPVPRRALDLVGVQLSA